MASCSVPLRKTGLLSRNTGLEPSSMESVPDGLNRDGYAKLKEIKEKRASEILMSLSLQLFNFE